jgi:hypothetical protein
MRHQRGREPAFFARETFSMKKVDEDFEVT